MKDDIVTIVSTALPVDERLLIKKNRLANGKKGKRVCIVTGTHGDELEGQYVCYLLTKMLKEKAECLDGVVEIYPALNPLGVDSLMRGIPGFDLDMNRIFPGYSDGTMAENTAHSIIEDLSGADMVLDIHSSNIFLREVPQARINIQTAETLTPYAEMLNMDFIWIHEASTVLKSTLAHSLNSIGTKCIVVEMGVGMRINHAMCNQLVTGIFNMLRKMGMWNDPAPEEEIRKPIISVGSEVAFVNAAASGVFTTELQNSCIVNEGDELGCIVSPLEGKVLHRILAPAHGFLFTIRAYPIVYEGSLIARIHKL